MISEEQAAWRLSHRARLNVREAGVIKQLVGRNPESTKTGEKRQVGKKREAEREGETR